MSPESGAPGLRVTHLARPDEPMPDRGFAPARMSDVHGVSGIVTEPGGGFSAGDRLVWAPASGDVEVELSELSDWRLRGGVFASIPHGLDSGLAALAPLLARAVLAVAADPERDRGAGAGPYDTARFLRDQVRLLSDPAARITVPESTAPRAALVAAAFGAVPTPDPVPDGHGVAGSIAPRELDARELEAALETLHDESWRFRPAVTAAVTVHEVQAGELSGLPERVGLEMLVVA